jgi:Tfp pilus assembly protein PilV
MAAHGFPNNRKEFAPVDKKHNAAGLTLIETMISMLILMFALLFLAQMFATAIVLNKNHGRDASKTTAFAHDKMEELNGLAFADTTTNLTVIPPYPANGKGLLLGGSIPPTAPAANYVDYLDQYGVRTLVAADRVFTRQWQIINVNASLKQINVAVTSTKSFNFGTAPVTVSVTYKAKDQ